MTLTFEKDSEAVTFLKSADPKLGDVVSLVGDYSLTLRIDPFESLSRSVVGQQLSVKAARTIWERLEAACGGEVTSGGIASLPDCAFKSAGVSSLKASYLKDIAVYSRNGFLERDELERMADEEIVDLLIKIRGVGRWTADMFLIFCLGRLDVFSPADIGLARAVSWLYSIERSADTRVFEQTGMRWSPYRSVASLYLWRALDLGLCEADAISK